MKLSPGQIRYRKYKDSYILYRKNHPELIKKLSRQFYNKEDTLKKLRKHLYGGLWGKVMERDNYSCQRCGMTNEEHIAKWKRHITIDHIDGRGSGLAKKDKNNTMENLQTLCFKCHGYKDRLRLLSLTK